MLFRSAGWQIEKTNSMTEGDQSLVSGVHTKDFFYFTAFPLAVFIYFVFHCVVENSTTRIKCPMGNPEVVAPYLSLYIWQLASPLLNRDKV